MKKTCVFCNAPFLRKIVNLDLCVDFYVTLSYMNYWPVTQDFGSKLNLYSIDSV